MIEVNNQELNEAKTRQNAINYAEEKENLERKNVHSFSEVDKKNVNILTLDSKLLTPKISDSCLRPENKIHITKLASQTFFSQKENKDTLKNNLLKIKKEPFENIKSEFSEIIKNPESIVENCVFSIAKNFGKKGLCVRNSYAMAKILLSESNEFPAILKDFFYKVTGNSCLEHYWKEKLIQLNEKHDEFVRDFDFSSENLEIAVNLLLDYLLDQPKNSILVSENEEHNYLVVINKNNKVFVVDADHGFISEMNYENIPDLIISLPGFFDDKSTRILTVSLLGNLNSAWVDELSLMVDKNILNEVIRPLGTDFP